MKNNFPTYLLSVQTPLYELVWNHIYDNFIDTEGSYQNVNVNGFISVQTIILGVLIVLAIAAIVLYATRIAYGKLVKKLVAEGCLSRESAKTFPELDIADKMFLRFAIKHSASLRRVVFCAEEEDHFEDADIRSAEYAKMREENPALPKKFVPKDFKIDPDKHRFYIPEDRKWAAESQFELKKNAYLKLALVVLISLAVIVCFIVFCPEIMGWINELAGKFFNNSGSAS